MEDIKRIYFLGIGGIGMSAIARYFLQINKEVFGYDKTPSEITDDLIKDGAKIQFEDDATFFPENIDLVIYTPAIPKTSALFNHILSQDIEMIKRSSALGMITKDKFTIAVAGSHGKTTVSSMVAHVLKTCGIDCSAFLGGISSNFNSNYVFGNDDVVVVEADEFDRSFMQLHPNIIVVTSIDTDHLDIYGNKENIVKAFQAFVDKLDENGILIINEKAVEDLNIKSEKVVYGFNNEEYNATDVALGEDFSSFQINEDVQKYKLQFNGRHNIENALAAVIVGSMMDIEETEIAKALNGFKGIKRRFEVLFKSNNSVFIDDYAHHPNEVRSTLMSIREIYPNKKLTCVFQPHLFSRTKDLYLEFAQALDIADEVLLLDIYPARELPIEGITSKCILEEMTTKVKIVSKSEVLEYVKKEKIEVFTTLGAGDINLINQEIIDILKKK
jgi:UDP-N-acetylmuramate--alanine ligase